jgi:predicted RNA-binding protein with PIN domain
VHIIIDGYNLIRLSKHFKTIERQDFQSGREALVEALAQYKKAKGYQITVVFDGLGAEIGLPRRDRVKGIELHYSRTGEPADAVIKRMAAREREKALVVSSDHDIVRCAEASGAAVIGASAFEERLAMARLMAESGEKPEEMGTSRSVDTRKKGPQRRLPKRQRRMMHRTDKL